MFCWLFSLSLSLLRAELPVQAGGDSTLVSAALPADTLDVDTLCVDTLRADTLPLDTLTADTLAVGFLSVDSLAGDSLLPSTLPLDTLPADTLPTDTVPLDTVPADDFHMPLRPLRVEDIDLDRYFHGADSLPPPPDTASVQPADTLPPPPPKPPTLMELLRRGEVIRSMIPDTIVVDSALLARLHFTPVLLDTATYRHNPLFNELVFKSKDYSLDGWQCRTDSLFYGAKPRTLSVPLDTFRRAGAAEILVALRQDARDHITRTDLSLYTTTADRLPKFAWMDNRVVERKPVQEYAIDEFAQVPVTTSNRIVVRRKEFSPWSGRLNALLQFSQTAVTKNWHKGGYNFFSLLGGLSGNLNFDNRKKMKWENSFEWRTGFNTVTGDTIGPDGGRRAMPSDDLFKVYSKFGLKAAGDFYYSTSVEFQTQFFDNPKEINNYEMKARLFTPIRFNAGVGMDYKYKNLSVALSPLSFKYIYLADTAVVDGFFIKPGEFGINPEEGKNYLAEIGSRLVIELKDYCPIPELKLNSKFNFYTNYKKVEIDWEIVAEFVINRFLSTRLMLNPRFDNTLIFENDEKAKIQMKELLTVGLSYRIL